MSGPLRRNKASFTVTAERRQTDENAFILATTLDAGLNPVKINQALAAPQSRTMVSPRLDYTLSPRNTLVVRCQELRIGLDNQGAGDFNLASRAYREEQGEHTLQVTETAAISSRAISETRFQFLRTTDQDAVNGTAPAIVVAGAFSGGGATTGNSGSRTDNWELANTSTYTRGEPHAQMGRARAGIAAGRHGAEQFRRDVHLLYAGAVPTDARVGAGRIRRRPDCADGRGALAVQPERRKRR